jgi:hypothetical protein
MSPCNRLRTAQTSSRLRRSVVIDGDRFSVVQLWCDRSVLHERFRGDVPRRAGCALRTTLNDQTT